MASLLVNEGVSGAPVLKAELSGCLGCVVGLIESIEELRNNKQKKVCIRVNEDEVVTVVTKYTSVFLGKLVCVAPAGAMVGSSEVEAMQVSGVEANGFLLDEAMLGWENAGPSGTVPILHPKQFIVGDNAPLQRPERFREEASVDAMGNAIVNTVDMAALSLQSGKKTKLSKEERAVKKNAKMVAKHGEGEEQELQMPGKKDIKAAKKRAADKRQAAKEEEEGKEEDADVTTDDELEAAGFMCQ
jgi:hypothetical protein